MVVRLKRVILLEKHPKTISNTFVLDGSLALDLHLRPIMNNCGLSKICSKEDRALDMDIWTKHKSGTEVKSDDTCKKAFRAQFTTASQFMSCHISAACFGSKDSCLTAVLIEQEKRHLE